MEKSRMMRMMRLVVVCSILAAAAAAADKSPEAVRKWFNDLATAERKVTNLHFYMHDIVVAKFPTAVQVAEAETSKNSATMFGRTVVMDDPLTLGPDPSSEIIGKAQGVYVSVSQTEIVYMLAINMVFTAGEYNGSTLTLLCSDPVFHESREMSIVGGTGAFRLARGVAIARTHSLVEIYNAVEEYEVFLVHY